MSDYSDYSDYYDLKPQDTEDDAPEEEAQPAPAEKEKKKHSVPNILIGLLVVLLAGFGAYQLVRMGLDLAQSKKKEAEAAQTANYYSYVIPVAAIDMIPFEDVATADISEMVELSVWAVLNSGLDSTQYQYDADHLLLPETQVASAFVHFFGTERSIAHATVAGYGYEFTYDAAAHVYKIPLTTLTPVYAPVITETETKGDSVVLTVGYLNSGLYQQDERTGALIAPEPDRYVKVTLRTASTGAYISALRALGLPETAMPSPTTAAAADETSEEASSADDSGEEDESASGDTSENGETAEDGASETKEETETGE